MSDPRHIWTSDEEEALLDIAESKTAKGDFDALQRIPYGFMKNAALTLRTLYPASNIQASHVNSKLRCFKDLYKNVQSVLSSDGFVWDTIECCLKAVDGAWDEYVQKGGSAKLKDKSCAQYNKLARIFGAQSDGAHINSAVSNVLYAEDALNSGGATVVNVTPCDLSGGSVVNGNSCFPDQSETISSDVWKDIASIREIVHHRHDTNEIYRALKKRHMDVNDAVQELLDEGVPPASSSTPGDESHKLATSSSIWSNQQQFSGWFGVDLLQLFQYHCPNVLLHLLIQIIHKELQSLNQRNGKII